ncbi:MAG: ANTAR domain-containing response regulator [Sphingopyxis sp.]
MRIAVIDESAARAAVIVDGLSIGGEHELFVLNGRHRLIAEIENIAPDVVLMDLGNPSRDVLEEYFTISRALDRPIAMFVDESDEQAIASSVDAGVSVYVVDGMASRRIKPVLDLAITRFHAFARLQAELAEAKDKLAARDAIDQAKRLLMKRHAIAEPEAFAMLRSHAMNSNRRMADIAEALVTAAQLLGETG